jgi:decaprenylphospho-beta-D-ribofuranose 2-oxidase
MTRMSGWGRHPSHDTATIFPNDARDVARLQRTLPAHVARGNGRAYGDAAIGLQGTLMCGRLDRLKHFDPATLALKLEPGVLLSDVIDVFLPLGFFPHVVPGTKFVTIGGMIACDVHGKNHHRTGGFGETLRSFDLVLPSGERVTCSKAENSELFYATIGGMGLTGTIVEACIELQAVETGWLRQRTLVAHDLDGALKALAIGDDATYCVAWIDCLARGASLGRSLIFLGEHATGADLQRLNPSRPLFPTDRRFSLSVPFDCPHFILNRYSLKAFNHLYYGRGATHAGVEVLVPWHQYFFPLDRIRDWNRIYGTRGFLQHQCVVPEEKGLDVLGQILDRVAGRGASSFLAVLKKLSQGHGLLSFPMPGYTLALDFPVSNDIFSFLDEIDRLVVDAGGRLYLAKDARQSRDTFEAGYPGLGAFRAVRKDIGSDTVLRSCMSERLSI